MVNPYVEYEKAKAALPPLHPAYYEIAIKLLARKFGI